MIIFDLEVIYLYRAFKDLMLNLLYNNIFAVAGYKYVPGTQINCICPSFVRNVEWMCRCGRYCFAIICNINSFMCFVYKGLQDFLVSAFPGFRVCSKNIIPNFDFFDYFRTVFCLYQSSSNKALAS